MIDACNCNPQSGEERGGRMLTALLDWRSGLFAAEDALQQPDPQRFVSRWCCVYCERHWITACGVEAQPCPDCRTMLARVGGVWDLRAERSPPWWRTGYGDYEEYL